MFILVAALLFLCLYKIRFAEMGASIENCLSLTDTISIKGICALAIILDHFSAYMPSVLILRPFHAIGFLVVGLFFFLSGYGLEISRTQKAGYLNDHFLTKRFITVLIPLFTSNILYLVFRSLNGEVFLPFKAIFRVFDIFGISPLNGTAWYIYLIVAFYFFYYICFRFFSPLRAIVALTLFLFIWTIAHIQPGDSQSNNFQMWGMNFCFLCGVVIAQNKNSIFPLWRTREGIRHFLFWTTLSVLSLIGYWVLFDNMLYGKLLMRNIGSSSAVICFAIIMQKIHIGNTFTLYVGKYSIEIYLLHMLVIYLLRSRIIHVPSDVVYAVLSLVITVAISLPVHTLNSLCIKRLRRILM